MRCSSSHHPAPIPISTRPPLMRSTVTAAFASTAGSRNVTGDTSVPIRMVRVTAASPPRLVQASEEPRSRWRMTLK